MKVEKLSKGKNKKIILAITIIVLAIGIIYITNSKAKYQITKSVQIVNGNVNYSLADLNVLTLSVQSAKGSNTYNSTDTVPTGDYKINTAKSYCTIGSNTTQLKNIPMEYKDGKVSISISKKGTKCYVFLDIIPNLTPAERVTDLGLSSISSSGCPAYSSPTISGAESSNTLLCKGQDDNGDTYYFRGKADKNWVRMGDTYWRIIRINGDGTIRLIYNGTGTATAGTATQYKNETFNSDSSNNAYVGLKYTTGVRNGFSTPSTMFNTLNTFYNEYFGSGKQLASYASKLDTNAGFCGDRTSNTSSSAQTTNNTGGTGTSETYYGAYIRVYNIKKPTFKCPDKDNDLYTKKGATQGNKSLTNPIGLITADEAMYAGGYAASNSEYWLYTGVNYWFMSPSHFAIYGNIAVVFHMNLDGFLNTQNVAASLGVRPVINLKANTQFTGNGTTSSPFVVQ